MRVLLAIDGSLSSDRARDLVASLTLPAGSRVRVVGVLEHGSELFGLPWMPGVSNDTSTIEPAPTGRFVEELEVAEREIARRNVVVDHLLLRGHAARAIVDEAREFGAEVVVVGSRGHGSFSTTVLGSTSAEVVDHAPCPVLVVRRSRIGSVLLAEDGSVGADTAAKVVDAWPILAGLPVTVVSVAEVGIPFAEATPGTYEQVMEPYSEPIESCAPADAASSPGGAATGSRATVGRSTARSATATRRPNSWRRRPPAEPTWSSSERAVTRG